MVSDFGCAKRLSSESQDLKNYKSANGKKIKRRSSFVGTSFYVSPEVIFLFKALFTFKFNIFFRS